jgi:hypothetical protein
VAGFVDVQLGFLIPAHRRGKTESGKRRDWDFERSIDEQKKTYIASHDGGRLSCFFLCGCGMFVLHAHAAGAYTCYRLTVERQKAQGQPH